MIKLTVRKQEVQANGWYKEPGYVFEYTGLYPDDAPFEEQHRLDSGPIVEERDYQHQTEAAFIADSIAKTLPAFRELWQETLATIKNTEADTMSLGDEQEFIFKDD